MIGVATVIAYYLVSYDYYVMAASVDHEYFGFVQGIYEYAHR